MCNIFPVKCHYDMTFVCCLRGDVANNAENIWTPSYMCSLKVTLRETRPCWLWQCSLDQIFISCIRLFLTKTRSISAGLVLCVLWFVFICLFVDAFTLLPYTSFTRQIWRSSITHQQRSGPTPPCIKSNCVMSHYLLVTFLQPHSHQGCFTVFTVVFLRQFLGDEGQCLWLAGLSRFSTHSSFSFLLACV